MNKNNTETQLKIEELYRVNAQNRAADDLERAKEDERVHASQTVVYNPLVKSLTEGLKHDVKNIPGDSERFDGFITSAAAMEILTAEQFAVITISVLMKQVSAAGKPFDCLGTMASVSSEIGERIWTQYQYELISDDQKGARVIERWMKRKPMWQGNAASFTKLLTKIEDMYSPATPWESKDHITVGAFMIQKALEHCTFTDQTGQKYQAFSTEKVWDPNRSNNSRLAFTLHGAAEKTLSDAEQAYVMNACSHPIMVVPPKPMLGGEIKTWSPYLSDAPIGMIKSRGTAHDADQFKIDIEVDCIPDSIRTAVDKLANTEWKINDYVLTMASHYFTCAQQNINIIAGLPTNEKFNDRTENQRNQSKRIDYKKIIETAEQYKGFEKIYFPYNLDFRTRAYALPTGLQPQGNDLAKGLLKFANKKKLGASGVRWLKIHIANCLGFDKASLEERVKYTEDRHDQIMSAGVMPGVSLLWWQDEDGELLDSPWVTLAAVIEYANAMRSENPEEFESDLPINVDGSCNGLQHHSAATLDRDAGQLVGLVAGEYKDLYQEHANLMSKVAAEDSALWSALEFSGDAWSTEMSDTGKERQIANPLENGRRNANWAQWWVPHLEGKYGRKLAKQPCMTTPYGVTAFGMAEQVRDVVLSKKISDKSDKGLNRKLNYFTQASDAALTELMYGPTQSMRYLQSVVKWLTSEGLPFIWTTPAGATITMSYPKQQTKNVNTLWGKIQFKTSHPNSEMNLKATKQRNSASANWVHSRDAAHMYATINQMEGESCAFIHDSFGTHACDMDNLYKVVRSTFADMYSGNVWDELLEQIQEYALELPEHLTKEASENGGFKPVMGKLDMNEVLTSERFFA